MSLTRRNFCKAGLAASVALGASLTPLEAAAKKSAKTKGLKAKRVLIITFDGICIEGFEKANIPNIKQLMKEGACSLATRDVMPSVTLPNYTSHMLGAGPEVHGVVDNGWKVDNFKIPAVVRDGEGYFPSVFQVLKEYDASIKTAYYWNWEPLIYPINQKYLDDKQLGEWNKYDVLYDRAFQFMKDNREGRTFTFLYSVHTDHVGHVSGWMSPEYLQSIEEGDKEVGRLINRLKEEGMYDDAHILFTSDHGGIDHGHGGVSEAEMIVPWLLRGPGIRQDFRMEEANNTVNTASTVLRLFGAEQPLCWTGEVPESIFGK